MADNKKKKKKDLSDDAEIQNLKAEMAHLEQLQAEWKTSHMAESAAPPTPQTPAQHRRLARIAKRRASQQKAITDVNEFFDYQREMLTNTWQKLELNVGERQKLTRMKREKRIATRKVRQNARKDAALEWRTLRKQNRENSTQSLQVARQESKVGVVDRRQEAKSHRIEKKDHTQQFREESKKLRKRNWQQYVRRQRRRTKRFMKFQNRLWWKGYLTFSAWILILLLTLVGIYYLFKALGIDLIELIQNI